MSMSTINPAMMAHSSANTITLGGRNSGCNGSGGGGGTRTRSSSCSSRHSRSHNNSVHNKRGMMGDDSSGDGDSGCGHCGAHT
mmetsp:Transcript_34110/g.36862  ORF Transcript_34110/g.36862 Transcript_34110/m.36862 type:complete len:83 (+) Transcript_34110:414-662(+)